MYRVLWYTAGAAQGGTEGGRGRVGGGTSDQHRPSAMIPGLAQHPRARRSDPHIICDNTCWPPWSGDRRVDSVWNFRLIVAYSPWMRFGRSDDTKRPGPAPRSNVNKLLFGCRRMLRVLGT